MIILSATITYAQRQLPGVASFIVPSGFPTSVFSSYYIQAGPSSEPQPALYDPVLNITYPKNLTDSKSIPTTEKDPIYYPKAIAHLSNETSEALVQIALSEIRNIIYGNDGGLSGNCSKCVAALSIGKLVAQMAPTHVPDALISLCELTGYVTKTTCETTYAAARLGAIWTQVLSLADVTGLDGRYICHTLNPKFCAAPSTSPLNITGLFSKPKPEKATAPKASGKRVKVLQLSDFHLDPRYEVASEVNCSSGMCCRYSDTIAKSKAVFPAPLFGAYK